MNKNNKNKKTNFSVKTIIASKGFYITLLTLIMVVGTVAVVRKFTVNVNTKSSSFDDEAWEKAVASAKLGEDKSSEVSDDIPKPLESDETYIPEEEFPEVTVPASKELSDEEIITKLNMVSPCVGSIIKEHSPDKLIYSKTMDDWRTHEGIDIAAAKGEVVAAAADGVVEEVYEDDNLGVVVLVGHEGGIKTLYANLQDINYIEVGRKVSKGDTIGAVGISSVSEGKDKSHLHFEVIKNGESKNPSEYIPL